MSPGVTSWQFFIFVKLSIEMNSRILAWLFFPPLKWPLLLQLNRSPFSLPFTNSLALDWALLWLCTYRNKKQSKRTINPIIAHEYRVQIPTITLILSKKAVCYICYPRSSPKQSPFFDLFSDTFTGHGTERILRTHAALEHGCKRKGRRQL